MRYLTRAMYDRLGNDNEDHRELLAQALSSYNLRLSEIVEKLGDLTLIAHPFHVDDALVAQYRRDATSLHLTLRCGNLIEGYRDLILTYHDVDLDEPSELNLKHIAATTVEVGHFDHDVYCHELDVAEDGRIQHSLLFNSGPLEVAIRCRQLTYMRQDQPDRTLPPLADRTPKMQS